MRELQHALTRLIARQSLSSAEIKGAVSEIFDGAPDSLTAAFLVALEFKAASGEELAGAAQAMLQRALPLDLCSPNILDTAGTGGDGAGTFNISTGAALVGAAAGAHVAKHGNRAASGK